MYADGFWADLAAQGYVAESADRNVRTLAHLSRWMDLQVLSADQLSAGRLEEFLAARRREGYHHALSMRAVMPLMGYLRQLGVAAMPAAPEAPALVVEYRRYLVSERALTEAVAGKYARLAGEFLSACRQPDGPGLEDLSAAWVTGYVVAQCRGRPPGSAKFLVTVLRSLLRFLFLAGYTRRQFASAVPTVAHWGAGSLPRALSPETVAALLATCDRSTSAGRRDWAILVLLARLGLRAGEVAGLELDDLDWRAGEISVHGKGSRRVPHGIPAPQRPDPGPDRPGGDSGGLPVLRAGGAGEGGSPPAAPQRGQRHARRRRDPDRGRAGTSSCPAGDHRDLRQDRPGGAARPGQAMARRCGMTGIRPAIDDYLAVRRALGYKLEDHGWLLADFAAFMETAGAGTITTSLALAWATLPEDALPSWHATRLRVVRGFARHLQALDPATEVPPVGLLACRNRRAVPYLYSEAEVRALMAATASLRPALHAATFRTLIGLLATTGMRLGEAIRLDRADLDAADGILTIRDSKFAKSRQIPLHPSTLAALAGYGQLRDQQCLRTSTPALLVSTAGTRLTSQGIHYVFARLVRHAGLQPSWATASQPTPTGTCRRSPSCWPWPPSAARPGWGRSCECLSPDPGSVLHQPARQPATRQPQHRSCLPGCLAALAVLRPRPHWQAAVPAGSCRPRRAFHSRLPGPPGAGTGQQRAHPERAAGRHPLVLPLRGAVSPRARRAHCPRAGHPGQESRPQRAVLPQPARGGRPPGRPRPRHLDRPARPRPARRGHRYRPAGIRADRPAQPRRRAGHRGPPQLHRAGPQTPVHAAAHADHGSSPGLDARTRWRARRSAVPDPPRHDDHPRRRGPPRRQACRRRGQALPLAARQAHHAPRATPLLRHVIAGTRRGHRGDRALARA